MSTLKVTNIAGLTGSSTNVMEGLCKAWINFDSATTGTPTTKDSFNVASITDHAGGDYTLNWSSSFANANYAHTGAVAYNGSSTTVDDFARKDGSAGYMATGSFRGESVYANSANNRTNFDFHFICAQENGDLA